MSTEDLLPRLQRDGFCCACLESLQGSEHINMVSLQKMATWNYPTWGNLLVEGSTGRAVAIICDTCVDNTPRPKIKKAMEVTEEIIRYHDVDELEDVPPITEEMLEAGESALWRSEI